MEIKLYDIRGGGAAYSDNPYMPQAPARILAVGPSGSGKTTAVLNMILEPKRIEYDNLFCYCKSPDEELFELLNQRRQISMYKANKLKEKYPDFEPGIFLIESNLNSLVKYEQLPRGQKNVIIIDDFLSERGKIASEAVSDIYFRSRKRNGTVFFMSQSFFRTPEDIRTNSNIYILCRDCATGKRNGLKDIQSTIAPGLDFELFKKMYETCTNYVLGVQVNKKTGHTRKIMGFLYVDTLATNPKLRFRCAFDRDPLNPDKIIEL